MSNPRISVVIPAKNEAETIEKCLTAVFSQSYEPHEVIVVDGHSTDCTVEIAKTFPVKILYEDYRTRAGACHVGLENSEGEYIAFTDADCIPGEDWLANLFKKFGGNVVGVGGAVKNIGTGFWSKTISLAYDAFLGGGEITLAGLFKKEKFVKTLGGLNSMYRKKDIAKAGGFNVNITGAEDLEISRRVRQTGKLLYTSQAIIFHDHRREVKEFARQVYRYAAWRRECGIWHVQELLVLIIPLSLITSLPFTYWVFWGEAIFYFTLLAIMGVKFTAQEKDVRYLFSIPIIYVIEHGSFVIGFWSNLIKGRG